MGETILGYSHARVRVHFKPRSAGQFSTIVEVRASVSVRVRVRVRARVRPDPHPHPHPHPHPNPKVVNLNDASNVERLGVHALVTAHAQVRLRGSVWVGVRVRVRVRVTS